MLPLTAAQLPLGLLLLLAIFWVVQRALRVSYEPRDTLLGLVLAGAAVGFTYLLTLWIGLDTAPTAPEGLEAVLLGLLGGIPAVGLNALLIVWRAGPVDARGTASAAGYGFALANIVSGAISSAHIRLIAFSMVWHLTPMLLLSILVPVLVSLSLGFGRDHHRLALYAVLAVLLLTLNEWADRTLLLTSSFVAYEVVAVLLAAGLLALVVRAYQVEKGSDLRGASSRP